MSKIDRRSLGRDNLPVVASLSATQLQDIWIQAQKQLAEPNELGCRLWKGSTQNGYPSISQGHGKSKIKTHMLAAYVTHGKLPNAGQVNSHLCHQKLCCNPDHIIVESIADNSRRNRCLHSLRDDNDIIWNLCCHVPRCLQRDHYNLKGFTPYQNVK